MSDDFEFSSEPRRRQTPRRKPKQSIVWQVALGIILAQFLLVGGCIAVMGVGGCTLVGVGVQAGRSLWAEEAREHEALYRNGGTEAELCDHAGNAAVAWANSGDVRRARIWQQKALEHKRKAEGRIR
jgi:hypothetical protein